ncbi:MAG: PASTA domain-containing protein [Acidobacteria bacterium]|nr:PASTA domain-containing protein [Acidobacteriota bacterium]MBS1866891.1 PASTA domain-containing protein [Acidobacteriota bacterium]
MQENRVQLRLLIVAGCMALWMAAVFGRLGVLQFVEHSFYLTRAHRQQQRTVEITPKRGAILDRNMHPLAMSTEVESAYAIPTELGDNKDQAARLLSGIVEIPREVLAAKFNSGNTFVWVSRKLPPEKSDAVKALNLKGIYTMKENERFYPNRDLAAHVLGFVNLDEKGISGLEFQLDKQVRGKGDRILVMADAKQRWFDAEQAKRDEGANVVLTLDTKIQYIVERELQAAIARTRASAGTVIVQNPSTGEILALANWPKFNPNSPNDAKPEARMNPAVSAIYEPGSTFKLITLAAAIDQNLTRPDEVFDCENGRVIFSGHTIHDHKKFSMLSVSDILAQSSDVGSIKIALRLGSPKFYDYIRAFGFGQKTGVELPWESRGMLEPLNTWSGISIGAISMGQEIGVTPIQLVTAVSAIANGGNLHKPYLISEIRKGDQLLYSGDASQPEPRQVLHPGSAATIRKLMEGVILSPHGTGKSARLDGWTAAGKTGTAQKIDPNTKRYSPSQYIASFTGFAPINNPAITILVSLDSPVGEHEGGQVAAPVFKRIAEQVLPYLDVPRDVPITAKLVQASYKDVEEAPDTSLNDFNPAKLDEPQKPIVPAKKEGTPPSVTVALDEGGDIAVPDFRGKTVREVTETCLRLGLDPVVIGSSLAQDQSPAAGAKVRRGAKITVRFDAVTPKTNAAHASKQTANTKKPRN